MMLEIVCDETNILYWNMEFICRNIWLWPERFIILQIGIWNIYHYIVVKKCHEPTGYCGLAKNHQLGWWVLATETLGRCFGYEPIGSQQICFAFGVGRFAWFGRQKSSQAGAVWFSAIWLGLCFSGTTSPILKGVPTSHSAPPLNQIIQSTEHYVWPSGKGIIRGQGITPLYPTVPEAVQKDEKLHELLALADAFRVGRTREKALAIEELKKRLLDGEQDD